MDVIDKNDEGAEHLLQWINSENKCLRGSSDPIYSLNAVWKSDAVMDILGEISPESFSQDITFGHEPQSLLSVISDFIQNQLGKRLRLTLKNKIAISPPTFQSYSLGLQLILFICLHSSKKSEYISRILQLPETTQTKIMSSVQKISNQLDSIHEVNQLLHRVTELENDNQNLKKQLKSLSKKLSYTENYLTELEAQNKQLNEQNILMKKQKEKVFGELRIGGLDDYTIVCRKIQNENIMMADYITDLQRKNNSLDQSYRDLQKSFGDRSMVIAELSDQILRVREKYNLLKDERCHQQAFDIDMSRSFGVPLENLQPIQQHTSATKAQNNQSLLDISYIKNKRDTKFPNFAEWCLQPESNKQNQGQSTTIINQQLQLQNIQLRKYNTDLMQKLQDTYKTVQNLTEDSSRLREKNKTCQMQNKFYQKQLKMLRQLHKQFERQYINGQL